jgi:hypothetical protein
MMALKGMSMEMTKSEKMTVLSFPLKRHSAHPAIEEKMMMPKRPAVAMNEELRRLLKYRMLLILLP